MKKSLKKTMKKIKIKRSKRKSKTRTKRKRVKKCINLKKIGGSGKYSKIARKTLIKNAKKMKRDRIKKTRKRILSRNLSMSPSELMKQRVVYTPSGRRSSASIHRKKTRV
mgnify:CR=1 FL=1|tara:strand:+ start:2337 stop:2666 length:330 start_codon:yes stop_codon:yes gene_type:complete